MIGKTLKRVSGLILHKYDLRLSYTYMCIYIVYHEQKVRIWSNGKISLCQGEDAGSIPAIRPR